MTYAEAVDAAESAIYDAIDHKYYSKGEPDTFRYALSVLRRAAPVMEAVEDSDLRANGPSAREPGKAWCSGASLKSILRAAVRYRDEKEGA